MSFFSQVPSHFVPRLVEVGRERLDRCDEAAESNDGFMWTRLAGDLHAFAGEASIMGLTGIGDEARRAEDEARAAAATGAITAEARASLKTRLAALRASIDQLASTIVAPG
jgi:HPt (histidine-containing phosphotransfer) domain-containing protein